MGLSQQEREKFQRMADELADQVHRDASAEPTGQHQGGKSGSTRPLCPTCGCCALIDEEDERRPVKLCAGHIQDNTHCVREPFVQGFPEGGFS